MANLSGADSDYANVCGWLVQRLYYSHLSSSVKALMVAVLHK